MQEKKIRIVCLPFAGEHDPGQLCMIQGMNANEHLFALRGVQNRFFGIILSAIRYKPQYIHFDWIESFYFRRANIYTFLNIPWFFIQIWICKYLFRIKIVWSLNNLLPHDQTGTQIKKLVQKWFAGSVLKIRLFAPNSIEKATEILKVSDHKFKIIPSGSFKNYYPNQCSKKEAFEFLNIDETKKVMLFFGSIKSYKNVLNLIQVFKKLANQDWILLIAGKCYEQELLLEIEKNLTENILLVNKFIEVNEVQYYYNVAKVVVLPFHNVENSGSVLMAMGFKKLIIAPAIGILPFRLQNQLEYLYEPGKLSASITKFFETSTEKVIEIGNLNYEILDAYKWEDIAALFNDHKFVNRHEEIS